MALVDTIETYGRAVAAGEIDREQAVAALVEAADGGITPRGADDLITNWETARSRYENGASGAFHGLAAIQDGCRPHPSNRPPHRG
ncbi:hypothetical protein [Kitasatospora sp. CMC57]